MRTFLIELLQKGVELGLLLKNVRCGGASGFLLQCEVHAFMAAVLLGMTGANAFNADAQTEPPHRKLREVEQSVGRSKRNAVVGADGLRQAAFLEKPLKGPESRVFFVRFQSFA